ncbi:MAG: LysR substrate-binding domain-containing protein [Desulfarculaceae bacterium]|jgi:DNA-binding transcriptional LysR family regulator
MELSTLKIFKTVAEAGSVSKAAQALHYVQPNVTMRVKQLEEELEVKLFHRKPKGMALTPAGEILRRYTEAMLKLESEAKQALAETGELRGALKLGSMVSTAAVRLPRVMASFHRRHPQVEINLRTENSEGLIRRVLGYELDAAFVAGPVNHPDIEKQPAFKETLVLVSPKNRRPLKDRPQNTVLVFPPGCAYRARLDAWLRAKGMIPYKAMELGTLEGILGCVIAGMGVTLLPQSVVMKNGLIEKVDVHAIEARYAATTTLFIRRKDAFARKAISELLEVIALEQSGQTGPQSKE